MIEIKNLNKSFGKNHILKGINTHIDKGQVVVVIGPSGSGKSTFLRCLNLLECRKRELLYLKVKILQVKK